AVESAEAAVAEDRCSTTGCPNPPTITHLERRLCDDCWARHCEEEERGPATDVATAPPDALGANVGEPVAKDAAVPLQEGLAKSEVGQANGASWDAATPGGKKRRTKNEPGKQKPKRTSALNAAAIVLKEAAAPMNCTAMIQAMATRGLWSSPNGKTPSA